MEDPLARVELLANVILADPLDDEAYNNLGLELLRHGAFNGALRVLTLGTSIAVAKGGSMTEDRVFDFALCEWNVIGPFQAVARIKKVLSDTRIAENARRARAEALGLDPGPEKLILLPPSLELLRLAIAVSEDEDEGITQIIDSYIVGNDKLLEAIAVDPEEANEAEIERARVRTRMQKLNRLWALLFAGKRTDDAEELFQEIVAQNDEARELHPDEALPDDVIQRFRGWLAFRKGEIERAIELLEPLVETDEHARWAMATLREQTGDTREAMRHFAIVARDNPRAAIGTAAWVRLQNLQGQTVFRSPMVRELDAYALTFAPWINEMLLDASRFMAVKLRHIDTRIDPLGTIRVRLGVRNTSLWPMGVGAQRPIPRRFLLAPRVRLAGQDISASIQPVVVVIDNRLRLESGEEIVITVHPTRDVLGKTLDGLADRQASIRWQAIPGFRTPRGLDRIHQGNPHRHHAQRHRRSRRYPARVRSPGDRRRARPVRPRRRSAPACPRGPQAHR